MWLNTDVLVFITGIRVVVSLLDLFGSVISLGALDLFFSPFFGLLCHNGSIPLLSGKPPCYKGKGKCADYGNGNGNGNMPPSEGGEGSAPRGNHTLSETETGYGYG